MKMGGGWQPQANHYVQNKKILLLLSNNIIKTSIYSLVKLGIVLSDFTRITRSRYIYNIADIKRYHQR